MSPLPSDFIKEVPGRSKQRVESSNPVPRGGNPNPKTSKVKLISPEEAMRLTSGANLKPVSFAPTNAHGIPQAPRPAPASPNSRPQGPKSPGATPGVPKAPASPEAPRPVPVSPMSEPPRPKPPGVPKALATPEAPRPVPASPMSEPPRPKRRGRPKKARATSETARLVPVGSKREIVCGLPALSMTIRTVRQRTNPRFFQSNTVEPPSPRALQILSRVKRQDANNATQAVEETTAEVGDSRAKDLDSREIHRSISDKELTELLLYRPAQDPTWKGRIVDSGMPPEFDCEFLAKPASNICRKAHRLSKAMPMLLKVQLLPTGNVLNMFGRSPRLSNVEVYLFPDEKKPKRLKGEHALLFEAMVTRNAMIKANINGTELLIFSSKLLDKTSQFIINTQRKTENFLWGCFLQNRNSQALIPGTSYQNDKEDVDDDMDIVEMDLDTDQPTPSLVLKLIEGSKSTPPSSPVHVNKEDSTLPPGFEKIWAPPLVKLNIQGTSNPLSDLSGYAGLARYQSGMWLFGYFRRHKSRSEVLAGLLAAYHGLKILWDAGFRRIRLETSSNELIDALTSNSDMFFKRKSILGVCKDMILKEWECEIYHISKEENLCAEWLARNRVEEQPQGLVFYEYPPRGLADLLEKDRLASAK